jgi:iron complex outermembrane recepter protein
VACSVTPGNPDTWKLPLRFTGTKNLDGGSHLRTGVERLENGRWPSFGARKPALPIPLMQTTSKFHALRVLAALAATTAILESRVSAADSRATEMAPFKVEAEFGPDGLRIQNSASVLNQYLLEQHGVTQLQDISGIAPNLFSSNSDSRGFGDILALRGAANSIFFSAPSVSLVVDDVPSGSVSSYPSSLLNIESFVVKAGPQGTDYGRNAPGGVIEIKTRAPGAKHQGSFLVDYGSFTAASVQASFDGPLSRAFGYSASIGLAERDGYIQNTFQNRTADDRRSVVGRGALYWKPDPTLQLRLGVQLEKFDDDAVRLSSLFSPDPYTVASNVNGETRLNRSQFSFQARKTFRWGSLVATTSRQEFDLDPAITDLDLSPLSLASSRVAQNERLLTQEIRAESTPTANRAQWRAGVFFSDSNIEGNALRQFVVPPSAFVPPGFTQSERTLFDISQTTLAAYANADHPIAPATTLKVGVRLEHADSDLDRWKNSSNNFGFPSPQDPQLHSSRKGGYISASGGVAHAISNSLSVQARTSIANKPHGFSGFTGTRSLARFEPERTWANEIGVTFGPPQSRFGGSLLAFWNKISDYQLERTVPNSTDFVVVNANEVISRGVEGKFMFSPAERVWWDFQAGYTDATFENHRDASGARVDGKQVPFIPKFTVRTGVTVDLGRGLSANASYAAVGRTFFDERNTPRFAQKAYGIVNAQVRYRMENWTVAVYGQNIFEENYYQFINAEIFAGSPGAPRRVGVQVSFTY